MVKKNTDVELLQHQMNDLCKRFNNHLEIYRNNGKELAAVKTNQAWLMKFFFLFMTPITAGIIYLIFKI